MSECKGSTICYWGNTSHSIFAAFDRLVNTSEGLALGKGDCLVLGRSNRRSLSIRGRFEFSQALGHTTRLNEQIRFADQRFDFLELIAHSLR